MTPTHIMTDMIPYASLPPRQKVYTFDGALIGNEQCLDRYRTFKSDLAPGRAQRPAEWDSWGGRLVLEEQS